MVSIRNSFSVVDYCIFGVTIIVSLGIGLYYALSGGKQRTTSEYFVGNRKMSILPVAISLMVSFESSIMMLGYPAEVYVYGLQLLIGNVGFLISSLLSILIAVPLIHPLKITSAYEYLHLRFESQAVRTLGTVLGMMGYAAYMGIVLFGPAIALEAVTGLPQWISIISVALASVIYTSIGGLKAVIWTDVFQAAVMFMGFFAVLIKGTMQIGGVKKTWEIAYDKGRVNMFNFDPDPTVRHTFWNLFFGSIIRGFGLVFNQSSVQRISSTPTIADARKVLLLVAPGFFLSLSFAGIEGVIAYAYYDTLGCDPLKSKQVTNPNQIIPLMVMDIFEGIKGMPGLFMASLFSASLSTLSSGLSSLSALFWADIIKPHTKPMSEFKATIISKLSVFVFGGLAVFVAFMIALIGGTLIQITGSLLSAFGGPLTGLFMFGAFCPWGNSVGAFWGTILSALVTFVFSIGQMTTKGSVKNTKLPSAPMDSCPASLVANAASFINGTMVDAISLANETAYNMTLGYDTNTSAYVTTTEMMASPTVPEPEGIRRMFMLSYQWFGALGILQVLLYGTIISFCTGYKKPGEVDRRYLISFWDKLTPFLPESIRSVLRCGYHSPDGDEKSNGSIDYIKVTNERKDVFNTEVMITAGKDTAALIDEVDNLKLDINGTLPTGTNHIVKSVDDLRASGLPARDMELELIKNTYDDNSESTFVVIDKDTMALRFKAKSMELDVIAPIDVPEISVSQVDTDVANMEDTQATEDNSPVMAESLDEVVHESTEDNDDENVNKKASEESAEKTDITSIGTVDADIEVNVPSVDKEVIIGKDDVDDTRADANNEVVKTQSVDKEIIIDKDPADDTRL